MTTISYASGLLAFNISWTFKAILLTTCQITTSSLYTSPGGLDGSIFRKDYSISISLGDDTVNQSGDKIDANDEGLIEPFITFVMTGLDLVKKVYSYPDVQLHRVTAKPSTLGEATNPFQLSNVTLECETGGMKLAKLVSKIWGEWFPFVVADKLLDDVAPTPWTDHMMDAVEDDQLMKAAGFKAPYYGIILESPVSSTILHKRYHIFDTV
jgi:hypothetical protein